ncbi:MAG: DUF447 family protein [Candidatus Lokiarchaeota archaeon]|nr:DUF447 family protein [Candidatus Lokiarchaeota archaeon]
MDVTRSSLDNAYPETSANGFELRRKHVYETIAGVLDEDGKPHFAPIGVRVVGGGGNGAFILEARVFSASKLYSCLKRGGPCTLHFPGTSQLEFFFLPFHHVLPGLLDRLASIGQIAGGHETQPPVLKSISNHMEATVSWIEDEIVRDGLAGVDGKETSRGVFRFASKTITIGDPRCKPTSRHDGLVLEMVVKASRFHLFPPGSKEQEATLADLLSMLDKMESIAPGDEKNVLARILLDSLRSTSGTRP